MVWVHCLPSPLPHPWPWSIIPSPPPPPRCWLECLVEQISEHACSTLPLYVRTSSAAPVSPMQCTQINVLSIVFPPPPLPPEAVAGVVGRADIGACLFYIASLCTYIKSCPCPGGLSPRLSTKLCCTRWKWLFCSLAFCLASMLTKELGITVLGVCVVYEIVAISNINVTDLMASLKQVKNLVE